MHPTWFEYGDTARAEESFGKALAACEGPPYEGSIAASVLNSRTLLAMSEGRLEQALHDLQAASSALEKSQAESAAAQRAAVLANIGSVCRAQQNHGRALVYEVVAPFCG